MGHIRAAGRPHRRAGTLVAADIVEFKLEMAKRHFGATHVINNGKDDLVAKVMELTNGVGVDYAFEVIATMETIALVCNAVRKGGTLVVVGQMDWSAVGIPIGPSQFSMWSKQMLGTIYGHSVPQRGIPRLIQMHRQGELKLDEMITREYRLDQVNEAYQDMLAGKNSRGVVRLD